MDPVKYEEYANVRALLRARRHNDAHFEDRNGIPYGEHHGYKLKPPYSVSEIEAYEKHIDTRLPSELREYLLYVSREFIGYNNCNCMLCSNITEFKLDMKHTLEPCTLPNNINEINLMK